MSGGPNNPVSTNTDSLPEYVAHYRILRRLGKAGMGEVFLSEDTKQHGRKVALKVLPRNSRGLKVACDASNRKLAPF